MIFVLCLLFDFVSFRITEIIFIPLIHLRYVSFVYCCYQVAISNFYIFNASAYYDLLNWQENVTKSTIFKAVSEEKLQLFIEQKRGEESQCSFCLLIFGMIALSLLPLLVVVITFTKHTLKIVKQVFTLFVSVFFFGHIFYIFLGLSSLSSFLIQLFFVTYY